MIQGSTGKQEDPAVAVGKLILHLVQPGTMFQKPNEDKLRYPEHLSESLVEFHRATGTSSLCDLEKVRTQKILIHYPVGHGDN